MANIKDTIKKARKRGIEDGQILEKIIETNPEKADPFKKAKERGANSSRILNEIVKQNTSKEKAEKESKEEEKPKEKQEDKLSISDRFSRFTSSIKTNQFLGEFFSITRNLLVGVDISDHSIEVLLLDQQGTVTSYGRTTLEEGIVQNGEIMDQKKLSETLKETLRNTKPQPLNVPEHTRKNKKIKFKRKENKAIVSLPDSKTYIQVFKFKNKQNLYNKISERVKKTIPFDSDGLYWDFIELTGDDSVKVLCVAAQRDIVDMYIYFFKSTNIDPVAFEIEGASIGRALLPMKKIKEGKKKKKEREVMADSQSRMIIDMGARTSILSIFNKEADLTVSVSLPYAGHYFTKKVAEKKDISKEKAEDLKQENGFKEGGKTFEVLKPHGEKIVKEIKRAKDYFNKEFGGNIKEIFLAGGTALLPDIDKFLDERVEPRVKLGDPLKKIDDQNLLKQKKPILYSNVIGLGLRSLLEEPIEAGINLLPEEVKSQAQKSQKENKRSILIAALFITIAGVILLGLSIYYLIYLPVPAPIQPLKDRVLLETQMNGSQIDTRDVAIINSQLETPASVYSGPGTDSEVVGEVEPASRHTATGQTGGWVRIQVGDEEGWINSENLEGIETVNTETGEPINRGEATKKTEGGESTGKETTKGEAQQTETVDLVEVNPAVGAQGLNVREKPTTTATAITTIQPGEVYEVLATEGDWIQIQMENNTGWAYGSFLREFQGKVGPEEEIEDTIQRLTE